MDSAVREISSSAPAQASLEPSVRPPNANAIPAINCLRVGVLPSAFESFLSLFINPPQFLRVTATHQTTRSKYVQDNLFLEMEALFKAYFSASPLRSYHAIPIRSSPGRQEEHHRQRPQAIQSPWL